MTTNDWFFPAGTLSRDPWDSVVDSAIPGWQHTGLRIATNGVLELPAGKLERMIVPLSGAADVRTDTHRWQLRGRGSVFDGPTDVLYLGGGTAAHVETAGRVAIAEAPTGSRLQPALLRDEEVPVEIRGAGRSTRQVHNFGVPGALPADRLIVCEVITPAENWSSYPPHKHDQQQAGESRLEEIYYFESAVTRGARAPATAAPFGLFSTYSSPAGQIDTQARVATGDIALVPHGYHGPAVAAPGYDLYYLNVMAGPDPHRAWLISDDPDQQWIRGGWQHQAPDPRLPYLPEEP